MGNFCFDDIYQDGCDEPFVILTENNRKSAILEIEVNNNELISYKTTSIYIAKDKLCISDKEDKDLFLYSNSLETCYSEDYRQNRNAGINSYYGKRKSNRDFKWFVKRVRLRYIKLMATNIINKYKYKTNVTKYLK